MGYLTTIIYFKGTFIDLISIHCSHVMLCIHSSHISPTVTINILSSAVKCFARVCGSIGSAMNE